MDTKKYAKAQDFEGDFKLIRVMNFSKENGDKVGAKFVDKFGNINRLTFRDADIEGGVFAETSEDRFLDSASYSYYLDFKNAKVPVGSYCLVLSLVIINPLDSTKSYRRWIFQPIIAPSTSTLPVIQASTHPALSATPNPHGDNIVDLGQQDSSNRPF